MQSRAFAPTPKRYRVVAIGDAVGTVDVLLGAGMSTAIERWCRRGLQHRRRAA